MSDLKITELTSVTTPLSKTEQLAAVQGGVTKKMTIQDILDEVDIPSTDIVNINESNFVGGQYNIAVGDLNKIFVVDLIASPSTRTINAPDAVITNKGKSITIAYLQGTVQLTVTTIGGTQLIGDATTQVFAVANETLIIADNQSGYVILSDTRVEDFISRHYDFPSVGASVLDLDFNFEEEVWATNISNQGITVNENITLTFSNATNSRTAYADLDVTGATRTITIDSSVVCKDVRWEATTVNALDLPIGKYKLTINFNANTKFLEISPEDPSILTDGSASKIVVDSSGITVSDATGEGFVYATDYTPFTGQQIPDAAWVVSEIGTFENGLTKTAGVTKLGGDLTGNTVIGGVSKTHNLRIGGNSTNATDYINELDLGGDKVYVYSDGFVVWNEDGSVGRMQITESGLFNLKGVTFSGDDESVDFKCLNFKDYTFETGGSNFIFGQSTTSFDNSDWSLVTTDTGGTVTFKGLLPTGLSYNASYAPYAGQQIPDAAWVLATRDALAGNGLTLTGGVLSVGQASNLSAPISFTSDSPTDIFTFKTSDNANSVVTDGISLKISDTSLPIDKEVSITSQGIKFDISTANSDCYILRLTASQNQLTIGKDAAFAGFLGLHYGDDLSTINASNPRWVPDKAYVDGKALTNGSGTEANGTAVDLGGELNETANITGNSGSNSIYLGGSGTAADRLNAFEVNTNGGSIKLNNYSGVDTEITTSTNDIIITSGGTGNIKLNSAGGNVGIGITPTSPLDVHGDIAIENGPILRYSGDELLFGDIDNNDHPQVIKISTAGNNTMILADSGRVGIGSHVDPTYGLDVNGTGRFVSNLLLDSAFGFSTAGITTIDRILDEDTLISDSETALATQQSIKAYVDSASGGVSAYQTLTSSPSITLNVNNGRNANVTLAHNATLTITNLTDGDEGRLIITQDGTGGRSLTVSTSHKVMINASTGALSDIDDTSGAASTIKYYYDGTTLYVEYSVQIPVP